MERNKSERFTVGFGVAGTYYVLDTHRELKSGFKKVARRSSLQQASEEAKRRNAAEGRGDRNQRDRERAVRRFRNVSTEELEKLVDPSNVLARIQCSVEDRGAMQLALDARRVS